MILSSVRRAAGVAALATVAALVATPAFQAQAAPRAATALSNGAVQQGDGTRTDEHDRRLATALSIRAVERVGRHGTVDVIRGVLRARRGALPRLPVVLLSKTADASEWAREGVRRTNRRGVVLFRVDPEELTGYRLVFRGTPRLQPARSRAVRVPVRPDVRIAADPVSIEQGDSTTISGLVGYQGAPLADAKVRLWAVKIGRPHSARVVARGVTDADGMVSFVSTPRVSTAYRLKVVPSDATAGTVSAVVRVRVVSPPTA